MSDGLILSGVRANALRGHDQWRNANISGVIAGEARASLVVRGVADGYLLGFASSDAGVTARAFGLYDHAKDGRMQLQARILQRDLEKPEIKGILRADDFVLVNAPLLARVMTLGSLRGINDAMSGNGIGFTRLELPFTMQGDVIAIQNGRAVGPALGLTGDVDINRSTDSVAASGTLIPAYTINSVLGHIPIIGDVLVGRRGEGVFALTFQIDGPVEEPRITVNPLSALAPGFLRRIVEGLEQPARPVDDDLRVPEPESFERRP